MSEQDFPANPSGQKTSALRGWLIRIGIAAPPKEEPRYEKEASEQQSKARQALIWHMLRPPQQ